MIKSNMLATDKKYTDAERLANVIESLDRVPDYMKQMIFDMSMGMTEQEIIKSFNQKAVDLFDMVASIIEKLKISHTYKVVGYRNMFNLAVKTNFKLPVDRFTLMLLEFAAEIYKGDENCFLDMPIPDKKFAVENEFGMIRSEQFKSLWRSLGTEDKNIVKQEIIALTTFAHCYLYKSAIKTWKR